MEPELMTADEWATLMGFSAWSKAQSTLRERNLVLPEPEPEPDPLLIEARGIAEKARRDGGAGRFDTMANKIAAGEWDDHMLVVAALAALKRGMEMRAPLTREMVEKAVVGNVSIISNGNAFALGYDFEAIHRALTKEQS